VKALFIPVDGPPREVDLSGGGTRFMRSLKALIGTECAERIRGTSRWEAWLDEDGAAAGKPVNQAATLVAQSFGFEFSFLGGGRHRRREQGHGGAGGPVAGPGRGHPRGDQGTVCLTSALSRRRCSMDATASMTCHLRLPDHCRRRLHRQGPAPPRDAEGVGDPLVGSISLTIDAVCVDLQQDRDAMPGTAGDRGRRNPGVKPQRDGGVP
jgi:hypothetical protein